ncbi:MAG: hypothetical protein A2V77_05695 [Anaeromyxobacter sp. RBG_16_69_14]|nr:MAG: hypothetical protein A2V77_05695 [Anaeromyxobacter sp. RBG_16_69_14]
MVVRDITLGSLYDARAKLTDLIIAWTPDPSAESAARDSLDQLILERDRVNGAINAIIATAFAGIATPELVSAAQDLARLTGQLKNFGKAVAGLNAVIKLADAVVQGAARVIALASKVS